MIVDSLPGCCAIGVISDWPEYYFPEDMKEVMEEELSRQQVNSLLDLARNMQFKRVFVSLNETQYKFLKGVMHRHRFRLVEDFMGNEGQRIYLYVKRLK